MMIFIKVYDNMNNKKIGNVNFPWAWELGLLHYNK
jgi:hypothetical protein